MKAWDVTLVTEDRLYDPKERTEYILRVLHEDELLIQALQDVGLNVHRMSWSDPKFDWSSTKVAVIRSTWDYFHRFGEFSKWLIDVSQQTTLINSLDLVHWNIDKHYLLDLQKAGINIPPSRIIEPNTKTTLKEVYDDCGWPEAILKPCVSGTARHTYRINAHNVHDHEEILQELIQNEAMILQEFMHTIQSKGEVSLMVFNGQFTHAILKQAIGDDFRVQENFGGTVVVYEPTVKEIEFAEHVMSQCPEVPIYGRVDVMWDNNDEPCIAEVEIIEPDLWFRHHPPAAQVLAKSIKELLA